MSVITAVEATPNRLISLWRYLRSCGEQGIERPRLRGLLSPRAETHVPDRLLPAAQELGLIEERDGRLRLAPEPALRTEADVLAFLEGALTHPTEAERRGQEKFPSALAWFLEQDPEKPPRADSDRIRSLVEQQCGQESEGYELTNPARWGQFVYWARYLGFAWRFDAGQGATRHAVMPDPTAALRRHLVPLLADADQPVPLRDVLTSLGQRCPVLEGGTVRAELARRMKRPGRAERRALSRSTSVALNRLEAQGWVTLHHLSDAETVVLEGWPQDERRSHISAGTAAR